MVVASCTSNGQTQERFAHLVDLLIDHVDAQLGFVRLDDGQITQYEEPGGNHVPCSLEGVFIGKQVTGDLLADETVERSVSVECPDDVIAIPPRVLGEDVVRRADHVRVARQVQPVPRPPLAKRR